MAGHDPLERAMFPELEWWIMKAILLKDLETRLEEHLREVRDEGQELTVVDRDTPIARIVPYGAEESLQVRTPRPDAPALRDVALPPPLKFDGDIVDYLLEERQGGR